MTLPFWFILIAIVVGIGGIWLALQTHWAEDRERRRIQIHQWALDEERAILKAATMPKLYKGYKMHDREGQ